MKLPPREEREAFYWSVVQKCLVSRSDRKQQYDVLRNYFLFGCSPDSFPATYNKINSHTDTVTSFLFAADTTRFSMKLGSSVNKLQELPRAKAMVERLHERWEDSNIDVLFGMAVTWSLVYDSMFVKMVQRGSETHPFLISPDCFGVLREDVPMLDRQEAFVNVFMTTRDQLRRDLEHHPNRDVILMRLTASRKLESDLPAGVQRIILSGFYPVTPGNTMTGNAPAPLSAADLYRARTSEELVECYELWLWDDGAPGYNKKTGRPGGYRVITLADPSICIYDRLAYDPETKNGMQLFLEGEHPFTQVCPNPSPDYFWGYSEVAKLCRLQDNRELHMQQADELVNRNVNSVKALQGMWGGVDEKSLALNKMNALISSSDPTAKINEFKPNIPTDLWQLVDRDDGMFNEASALPNVLQGKGDTGVRSKGQTDALARFGSSRTKKRALVIEDSLERVATLYCKLDQAHNPVPLYIEKPDGGQGNEFLARQFTTDYMVKVDGHSSSPVFMEDQRDDARWMYEAGIIDGEAYIEMSQPQDTQALKQRWKQMNAARMRAAQEEKAAQQASLQEGGAGGKVVPMKGPQK